MWLDGFLDGFFALATRHGVALIGGDTTRGPLAITVTVHGFVPHGEALRRDGARVGDAVWVSGTLGDAAAGLRQWREGSAMDATLRAELPRLRTRAAEIRAHALAYRWADCAQACLALYARRLGIEAGAPP